MKKKIENFTIKLPCKLKTILEKINLNQYGIIFIVAENLKLLGSISDGDIRRALIKKPDLKKIISYNSLIVNKKIIFAKYGTPIEKIFLILSKKFKAKKIRCLPLTDNAKRIVDIATEENLKKYPIAEPLIGSMELVNIIKTVKSGWISSRGKYISEFEKMFSNYLGGGYCVAVSSGTTALQTAISALGLKKNDEIIVPNFTFAATINSVISSGCKPILVDVEKETWTIDINQLKKKITSKTRAIMPVHIYGQPYRIDEVKKIAKKYKLFVIDDCAEAIGATYKNKLVGLNSDVSCFSFFANKTITTGEGGMVVFKSLKLANKARILINHGMSPKKKYFHEMAGFNFRMTNIQAGIGVAQIKRIKHLLKLRKKIFKHYDRNLGKIDNITLLPSNNWSTNSMWLYTILIEDISQNQRDKLIRGMMNCGIECRPGFASLNTMKPFKKYSAGSYKISNNLSSKSISIPSSNISATEQNYIVDKLKNEIEVLKK